MRQILRPTARQLRHAQAEEARTARYFQRLKRQTRPEPAYGTLVSAAHDAAAASLQVQRLQRELSQGRRLGTTMTNYEAAGRRLRLMQVATEATRDTAAALPVPQAVDMHVERLQRARNEVQRRSRRIESALSTFDAEMPPGVHTSAAPDSGSDGSHPVTPQSEVDALANVMLQEILDRRMPTAPAAAVHTGLDTDLSVAAEDATLAARFARLTAMGSGGGGVGGGVGT